MSKRKKRFREMGRPRVSGMGKDDYWLLTTLVEEPFGTEFCTLAIPSCYSVPAQNRYVKKILGMLNHGQEEKTEARRIKEYGL